MRDLQTFLSYYRNWLVYRSLSPASSFVSNRSNTCPKRHNSISMLMMASLCSSIYFQWVYLGLFQSETMAMSTRTLQNRIPNILRKIKCFRDSKAFIVKSENKCTLVRRQPASPPYQDESEGHRFGLMGFNNDGLTINISPKVGFWCPATAGLAQDTVGIRILTRAFLKTGDQDGWNLLYRTFANSMRHVKSGASCRA